MPVTLRHIAQKAGVSVMTVSRALRNHPEIADKTRIAIQKIAESLGYRPDPRFSELMQRLRTASPRRAPEIIALVWPRLPGVHELELPRRRQLVRALNEQAHSLGYQIETFSLNPPQMTGERLSRILDTRRITGILIPPIYPHSLKLLGLEWSRFAVAAIGHVLDNFPMHRAMHDHFGGIQQVFQRLHERGLNRFGLILQEDLFPETRDKYLSAFYLQQIRKGFSVNDFVFSDTLEKKKIHSWIQKTKPQALILSSPWILDLLPSRNTPIYLLDTSTEGSHSGVDQHREAIASAALDLVIGQLRRHERGLPQTPKTVLIPGKWTEAAPQDR